jgi:hypothetical protein
MGIFKKLFAKGADGAQQTQPQAQQPADHGMIVVHDEYGREMRIPRSEWVNKVLPATIEKQRSNPDALYDVLVAAVRDGFAAQITDAAQHLYQTETAPFDRPPFGA